MGAGLRSHIKTQVFKDRVGCSGMPGAVGAQKFNDEGIECRGVFDITGVSRLWKESLVYGAGISRGSFSIAGE